MPTPAEEMKKCIKCGKLLGLFELEQMLCLDCTFKFWKEEGMFPYDREKRGHL